MLNDPSPQKRHPLENAPRPAAGPPGQQVKLVIPSNRPLVTYMMLAINILIFAVRALSPTLDQNFALFGANNQTLVLVDGEFYRLLTSMFLHASIYDALGGLVLGSSLHLIFNCYLIYTAGANLERLIGSVRYLIIYLLGGVAGSVLSALLGSPNSYSVGASGAVFAIIGAEFMFLYRHRRLLGAQGRAQMRSLASWALINFAFGALSSFSVGLRIDNWAHLGGLAGGLLLAALIAPYYLPHTDAARPGVLVADDINPLRERLWMVSLYVAVLLVVLIVARQLAIR